MLKYNLYYISWNIKIGTGQITHLQTFQVTSLLFEVPSSSSFCCLHEVTNIDPFPPMMDIETLTECLGSVPFFRACGRSRRPFPPTAAPCMHNRSGPSCSSRWQSDGANWKTHCWCPSEHRPGWDDKASPEHVQDSKVNRHSNVSRMQCNICLYIYIYAYIDIIYVIYIYICTVHIYIYDIWYYMMCVYLLDCTVQHNIDLQQQLSRHLIGFF